MKIGDLAEVAGVNVETIRYYQRRGLLRTPIKPYGGTRSYTREDLSRLRFVLRSKELGFTLNEIAQLLELGDGRCDDVREVAERQRHRIAARIADLSAMQSSLDGLIRRCGRGDDPAHCPLIEALSQPD